MRNLKKVVALVAVFAMLVSTVAFAASYTDVADTDNYSEAIEMLSSLNILTGDKDANGNAVFRPNDPITRAEVAAIVERIQNINNIAPTATQFTDVTAEHWASGYIAQAAGQGIINGYGDGTFGPEDNVLYEQAIKMLVEALGYAPFVEVNGGYYAGHLLAASRYGILDGVKGGTPGQEATRGQVAQLVYNAIDTPIMERSTYGTEERFVIYDGDKNIYISLLTRDLGIYKGTAIVNANAVNNLGVIDTSEPEVIGLDFGPYRESKDYTNYELYDMDGATVYANGTNAGDYMGLEVNFYAEEASNGKFNLIGVAPTTRNKTMSVALSDVISFDGSRLKYYEGDNSTYVDLADEGSIALSYNGYSAGRYASASSLKAAFDEYFDVNADDAKYSGQIILVDNGSVNGYSAIALEVAVSVVVDEIKGDVVSFKEPVKTTDGKTISKLDFDPDVTDTLIKLTKNGAAFDYSQLTEWDVISILANNSKDYYVAEVIDSGKITGAVEERAAIEEDADDAYEYEWKINGEWYEVAINAYGVGSLKPSSEGTFYVDSYGKIVAFDKTSSSGVSSDKYAYIMNASVTVDEWGNNGIRVQWLDKSGEIGDTYLASTVTIQNIGAGLKADLEGEEGVTISKEDTNDITYYDARIKMETFAADGNPAVEYLKDALVNQFVTYALSADSIKTITLAMNEADEDVDLVNLVASDAAEYDEENKEIKIGAKKYDIDDNTIVFYVDAEDDEVADGAIASKYLSKVSTAATLPTGDYPRVDAFDLENDIPTVLVVYDCSDSVSPTSNIAVIESVGKATIDGEEVTSITYWMNGEKATAYSDPTADATSDLYDITEAQKGDIWKITVNGTTVTGARLIAAYDRASSKAGEAGAAEFTKGSLVGDPEKGGEDVVFGPVVDYKSSNSRIVYAPGANFLADTANVKASGANVYVVEYVRGKLVVSVGAAIDAEYDDELVEAAKATNIAIKDKASNKTIVPAGEPALGMMDYVLAVSYDDKVQDVVIYKAGSFDKWYAEEVAGGSDDEGSEGEGSEGEGTEGEGTEGE